MRVHVLALVLACSSCADLAGVDKFHKRAAAAESAQTGSEFLGLKLALVGMRPHVGQMVEYRVIDANNYVQSRGVIRAMPGPDLTIETPRVIPKVNAPYRIDMFADVNGSGGYDGIGSVISNDHAWRIDPLIDKDGMNALKPDDVVAVTFQHSTSFTNIDQYPSGTKNPAADTGLGALVHLQGLSGFQGKMLEARVADDLTHHVVAVYRAPVIDGATLDATVPGCVDLDTEYDIDVWVDANGNGAYDSPADPGGDRGWRVPTTSALKGVEMTLDLGSVAGNIDVGAP